MVEFLSGVVPVRVKESSQLISHDTHSYTANQKFTYSVEIIPVCKDDLVCLPRHQARAWGNISQLLICSRIGNTMHLLDPITLQQTDLTASVYWRTPFESLATVTDLVEFVVLDVEPTGASRGKYVLADAQITRASGSGAQVDEDGMGDDGIYHTRTHLGSILQPGDTVLGYHLTNSNFNNSAFEELDHSRVPNVLLIRKTYPNRRKKNKPRNWKLRSIAKEAEDVPDAGNGNGNGNTVGRGALGRRGGNDQKNVERDYELFLRDLEEDKEMRAAINLYRHDANKAKPDGGADGEDADADGDDVEMGDGKKAGSGLKGGKRRAGRAKAAASRMDVEQPLVVPREDGTDEDADDEEEDFPEIELDELLEHFEEMDMKDELEGGSEVQ